MWWGEFKTFDKDNNGQITASEFGKMYRLLGQNATDKQLEDIIKKFDTIGIGVCIKEYRCYMEDL